MLKGLVQIIQKFNIWFHVRIYLTRTVTSEAGIMCFWRLGFGIWGLLIPVSTMSLEWVIWILSNKSNICGIWSDVLENKKFTMYKICTTNYNSSKVSFFVLQIAMVAKGKFQCHFPVFQFIGNQKASLKWERQFKCFKIIINYVHIDTRTVICGRPLITIDKFSFY